MAKAKAAWGIEVGSAAVKAVRLERDGSDIRVADFIVIPHSKVLTTPDLNVEEMLRMSLGGFMAQKTIEGAAVVVGVPGNEGLARFAKLPPIPKKQVPPTVLFEAKQQIPFPLEEVEWDYHLFSSDDSPEYEVGIFAILKEKIAQRLSLYKELQLRPTAMTLGPIAVYNAMMYDRDLGKGEKPVIAFLDIGTRATDLVVIQAGRAWIRTFPVGGHHFTEAIASAFNTPYGKADRLKAEAATHKYAKQLMQAMRPVFDDLLQEVQRSLGHYQSLHPDTPVTQVVGLGSTFRIPGLRKYLSDQLQVEIRRLEEFEKVKVEGSAASDFAANAMNLATAIGLALQGLGMTEISTNLSPVSNLREQVWSRKARWFVAAALLMCAGSALLFYRPGGSVGPEVASAVTRAEREADGHKKQLDEAKASADVGARANNFLFTLEDRKVWPWLVADVNAAIASAGPQDALTGAFDPANPPVPYAQWQTVELSELSGRYKLATGGAAPKRTVEVTMRVIVPRDEKAAKEFVQQSVIGWLNKNADRKDAPYVIVIPEKGIVPQFAALGASPDAERPSQGGASGGTEEAPQEVTQGSGGSAAMGSRNTSGGSINRSKGQLGGSGFGSTVTADDPAITGEGGGSGGGAGGGKGSRKAARVAIKSTAAEPVNIDADAAIPSAPNPYAGRAATTATIRFTVELRPPVGREIAPAPAGDGATPEGEQQ